MRRIVIIGNGFDLAHGLKTSYKDFIKYIIKESCNHNEIIREKIIDVGGLYEEYKNFEFIKDNFENIQKYRNDYGIIKFKNEFFNKLISRCFEANWIDIEKIYFQILTITPEVGIKQLQSDFDIIKEYLKIYLLEQLKNANIKMIPEFLNIFKENKPKAIIFLNFNYTQISKIYLNELSHIKSKMIINIHGVLNSNENPIIFGYGDDTDDKYKELIDKDINDYMRNLKRQQYNLANEYTNLNQLLNTDETIEVYTIGHSLGLTDKSLLKEVMENKYITKIKMFYHKDKEGFRFLNDNLRRIIDDDRALANVVNYTMSSEIPQVIDKY